jgi:hypothetical protein
MPRDLSKDMHKQAMSTITTTAALVTALLSEIQLVLRFEDDVAGRLKYLWSLINECSTLSKNLYARRYQDAL